MIKVASTKQLTYDLHVANTPHKNIVTLVGTRMIPWWIDISHRHVIFDVYGMMLDRGTESYSKLEIAEKLESIGASIHFSMQSRYLLWQVSCLTEDFAYVMQLVNEMLQFASFPEKEWHLLQQQLLVQIQEAFSDTEVQADIHVSQQLYTADHPHYQLSSFDEMMQIKSLTIDDLKECHRLVTQLSHMTCVVVGDSNLEECERIFEGLDLDMSQSNLVKVPSVSVRVPNSSHKEIHIVDKPSITCVWAYPLPFDLTSEWFMPTKLAVDILGGGGFSGRLMKTVREESGLTYRIGASLRDIEKGFEGYWQMYASFGRNELAEGVKQTEYQQKLWYESGVTKEELDLRKQSLLGQQALSWTRTSSIARSLMYGLMNGYGPDYLDVYPKLISEVSYASVNEAIERWGSARNVVQVLSGSLPEKS